MSEAESSTPAERGSNRDRRPAVKKSPRANMQGSPASSPPSDVLRGLETSDLPPDEGSGRGFSYEWERTAAQITQQTAQISQQTAQITQQIASISAGVTPEFRFDQAVPAAEWTITHGLNGFPSVLVVDSSGQELMAEIRYPDDQTVVVNHSQPYSGIAYLRL